MKSGASTSLVRQPGPNPVTKDTFLGVGEIRCIQIFKAFPTIEFAVKFKIISMNPTEKYGGRGYLEPKST